MLEDPDQPAGDSDPQRAIVSAGVFAPSLFDQVGKPVEAVLERRVDEAEGRADALGLGYKKSLDEEIAELQAADKVADELAALKAAQGKK